MSSQRPEFAAPSVPPPTGRDSPWRGEELGTTTIQDWGIAVCGANFVNPNPADRVWRMMEGWLLYGEDRAPCAWIRTDREVRRSWIAVFDEDLMARFVADAERDFEIAPPSLRLGSAEAAFLLRIVEHTMASRRSISSTTHRDSP
jgi:hypothetical protein